MAELADTHALAGPVWAPGLAPHGCQIPRVPNSGSLFSGNHRYGDLTHERSFTARNLRQVGAAAGFGQIRPSVPAHRAGRQESGAARRGAARRGAWALASGAMKVALASETGSCAVTSSLMRSSR